MKKSCQKCGTLLAASATSCPVCHTSTLEKLPQSNDNTAFYQAVQSQLELVRVKSRRLVVLLHGVFGFLGVGYMYLGFYRRGWTWLLATMLVSILFYFFIALRVWLLIGWGLLQLGITLYYALNPDARDVKGELLG
jgi:TM2 domain-containing membrane protein YozV